jgi:integrase
VKNGITNARAHAIALPHVALAIIEKIARRADNDRLFGKGDGGFGGWSKAKAALDDRIVEARKPGDVRPMAPWTVHDIRRSVATHMADKLGVQPHIIEPALNHVSGHKAGAAGVYNRATYEREVTAALALWADHLRAIALRRLQREAPQSEFVFLSERGTPLVGKPFLLAGPPARRECPPPQKENVDG